MMDILRSTCVFCQNVNVNYFELSTQFRTSAECGHQVCASCYRGPLFQSKKEVACKACGRRMRKAQLREQSWEDIQYEKELKARREIMRVFNLAPEDVDSRAEYDDLCELAETLVAHRLAGTNLDWVQQTLEQTEAKYRTKIQRRRAIRADERRRFLDEQASEQERRREMLLELMQSEEEDRQLRQLEKEEGVGVLLGERRRSKVAEIRARKRREQAEARERAAIQQGYGPQVVHFQPGALLWTAQQQEQQPRKESVQVHTYDALGPAQLRSARQEAGGLDAGAWKRRTQKLLVQGLV